MRRWTAWVVAVLAMAGVPAGFVVITPAGQAGADVCASAGRRISVGGCVNIADTIAAYAPPPDYYAPLPEDFTPSAGACVGYNGRWVSANGCTP